METKKISKWDAAPKSIKNMQEIVNALYDPLPDEQNPIIDALSKVLDDYNELEAKYQKQCGMISEYEEERQKDGEFAKWIGNRIVECIKQGAEHGYYEVNPFNRFDIHIEETSLTPMPDRHAIPKIAVQCNNVQTEMERDTAQHELEALQEKYDELDKLYDKVQNDRLKEAVNASKKSNENALLKEDLDILKEEKVMLASKNKALGMEICERNKQIHELKEEIAELEKEKIELEDRLVQQKRNDTHEILIKQDTIDRLQQDIRCLKSLAMDLSGKIIRDDREDAIPDDVTTMSMCGHYYWYKKPDGEKKEKLSGRYPWGNEKHKYKMFECPYLKDKYYNF